MPVLLEMKTFGIIVFFLPPVARKAILLDSVFSPRTEKTNIRCFQAIILLQEPGGRGK